MSFRNYFTQHAWWGKLLGAGLGFLIGGPPGALLGIFIGNLFDKGLHEHISKPHWHYHAESSKNVKQAFLRALFLMMGNMAKVDGRVSEQEIQFTKTVMQELRLNSNERTAAQRFFTQGKEINFQISEPLDLLKQTARNNPNLLRSFMQIQYKMAQVDGLTQAKVTTLNIILNTLGFAPLHRQAHARESFHSTFNQQHNTWQNYTSGASYNSQPTHALDDAYAMLKVPEDAEKQDVKRAYRRLISKYHPDKYIAEGKSEQAIKQANEKTQAIRKAYECICAYRGW
jgi:DnaJ like chaperone protein